MNSSYSKKALARWVTDPRVESADVEWDNLDGWNYWVFLRAGWVNNDGATHVIHELRVADVDTILTMQLQPCDCDQCLIDTEEGQQ